MKTHSSPSTGTPVSLALGGTLHWQEDVSLVSDTYDEMGFFLKLKSCSKTVGTFFSEGSGAQLLNDL